MICVPNAIRGPSDRSVMPTIVVTHLSREPTTFETDPPIVFRYNETLFIVAIVRDAQQVCPQDGPEN